MNTNAPADAETEQLSRLDTQPEEAMTALVEQYTALVANTSPTRRT